MRYLAVMSLFAIVGLALNAEEAADVPTPGDHLALNEEAKANDSHGPDAHITNAEVIGGPAELPDNVEVPSGLTVQRAEELLIRNNLAVIAARYGVDSARAAKVIAAYHPNPSLLLAAQQFMITPTTIPGSPPTDVHAFSNPVSNNPSASNRTYTFEFDLPIETAGKRHKRIDNAQSQLMAAEAQVLDAVRNQVAQMKTLYYSAVLARENEKVAAQVLESVDRTEALIKRQVGAGNTPEAQLITFQANRITFEQPLIAAQLSYEQSIRDLLNILAAKPEDVTGAPAVPDVKPSRLSSIELAGTLDVEPLAVALEDLRHKSGERPDVIAAQRNLEAAERNDTLTHALRSPDITVGTQYARVGSDNTAGVSFTVPLPLFNNKEGEIAQAESQLRIARTQLRQVKLQALTDVDKAFRGYELNLQVLKLYDETAIKRALESLDIVEKAYERGATSLLEVLDARRTYRQTLVARDQARFNVRQSILQLEQSSGTKLSK